MNKTIASGMIILVTVVAIVGVVLMRGAGNYTGADNQNTKAAYRDGIYLGNLAAARGESPHISSGRWAELNDQNSFASGYAQAYGQRQADRAEPLTEQTNAAFRNGTNAAFRDGLYVGKLDAEEGRPVHVSFGRWSRAEDRTSFNVGYTQAYDGILLAREASHRDLSQASRPRQ